VRRRIAQGARPAALARSGAVTHSAAAEVTGATEPCDRERAGEVGCCWARVAASDRDVGGGSGTHAMSRAAYSAAATPSGQARCGPASPSLHRHPENAGRRWMPHDRSMRSHSCAAPERSGAAGRARLPGDSRRQRWPDGGLSCSGAAAAAVQPAPAPKRLKLPRRPVTRRPTSVPSGAARCLSSRRRRRVRLALREGAEFSPAACRTRGGRAAAAHVLRDLRAALGARVSDAAPARHAAPVPGRTTAV
jgi:hypothetical protein